jgi:hypothetical protein
MKGSFYLFLFMALAMCLIGCFREVLHDPASLKKSNEGNIVVVTKDSSRYHFDGGSYNVSLDTNGVQTISGHAKKYQPTESKFTRFEGCIPLGDIEKISSDEKTPFFYISLGVATIAIGLSIWVVIAFSHLGTGG